ncbi:MAG TPA: alpha/beta hydrolase [Ruminiclostridium sp.]|nr:alpha/beta hydrolase [Ruminiclostridium sp.]
MKTLLKVFVVLILIVFAATSSASFYLYNMAVARTSKDFLENDKALKQSVMVNVGVEVSTRASNPIYDTDWISTQPYKQVSIVSYDGLKLNGYYLAAKFPSSKTVILAHGYSSKGLWMGPYAKMYYLQGYNVLMPDDRGQGNSEGSYIGFGWVDRRDYLKWIDYVIDKTGPDSQIVLHGVSMGGAAVLMTGGESLPSNVKAIVSDCAYTSVKDELSYQLMRMYHLPSFPLIDATSLLTKLKAGYTFEEASALNQVRKSKTPTLFIHGGTDEFVPTGMVKELYHACSSEKELYIVPGAGHGASFSTNPAGYINEVKAFLEKYVKN